MYTQRRRRNLLIAFGIGLLIAIGTGFYLAQKLKIAAAGCMDCWSINGYWRNHEDHSGPRTFDANGARHTTGQPDVYTLTVWIYGNSAMEDPLHPDNDTTASQLQALLTRRGYMWRVVNMSAPGQLAAGSLAWLRDTDIRPGDLVIFVDGSVDRLVKTPLIRYHATITAAEASAHARGARFYHFVQAYIDPAWCCAAFGAPRLNVPKVDFAEESHMTPTGAAIVAQTFFNVLTPF